MGNDGRMAMNFREAAPCSLSPLWDDCLTHPVTLDRHEWGAYDDLFTTKFQLFASSHPTSHPVHVTTTLGVFQGVWVDEAATISQQYLGGLERMINQSVGNFWTTVVRDAYAAPAITRRLG